MALPVFSTGDVPTAQQVNDWFVNVIFKRKTSDQTLSATTTLTNDTELVAAVSANAIYHVTARFRVATQAVSDFKLAFTGPAGYAFDYVVVAPTTTGGGFTDYFTFGQSAGTTNNLGAITGGGGNISCVSIDGVLITSGTAGNLQTQFAQLVSDASGTTMKTNSFMSLRRVA